MTKITMNQGDILGRRDKWKICSS